MMRPLILAIQLLTRLPTPALTTPPRPQELGQAVAFFPLVGVLMGALLAGVARLLGKVDAGAGAALLLILWVGLTGGVHLDGLADTADAWIGGQGDRERTLKIMKDSHSGPLASVAIGLVLLTKFAALHALLIDEVGELLLLLTPVLGRTVLVLLLVTTPYIRPDGLGFPYAHHLSRPLCLTLTLGILGATIGFLHELGVLLLSVLSAGFLGMRLAFVRRLGGVTGDTLGAACELTETIALLVPIVFKI